MFGLLLLIVADSARQDIFETEWVTLLLAVVGRVCPRYRRTFPGNLGWITQSTLFLHSLDSTVTDGWAKHHEPVAKIRTLYISMILSLTGLVSIEILSIEILILSLQTNGYYADPLSGCQAFHYCAYSSSVFGSIKWVLVLLLFACLLVCLSVWVCWYILAQVHNPVSQRNRLQPGAVHLWLVVQGKRLRDIQKGGIQIRMKR